nr:uncharacterized protein LOC100178109 [Ciona intestinalis]|eukprot:XP_026690451.1 uncharacterized protein LOC100178109 [Ciona intestinalis]
MSNDCGQNIKKRRKRTGLITSGDSDPVEDTMKLKPENDTTDSENLLNGHVLNEKEKELINSYQETQASYLVGDRCHHHRHKSRFSREKESVDSNVSSTSSSTDVTMPTTNNPSTTTKTNIAQTCNCKTCIERRNLESEHMLDSQLRHAWTQVRHLVRCAYHDPLVLTNVNADEFKAYVELLVAKDPHLLFLRIESQARDYVNEVKTRLLKQLTNGYNTPQLACNFVNVMFNEFTNLLNTARTVATFISHLEENHLSKFKNITWEQYNMFLYQSMVHSEKVFEAPLLEILSQLKQGSAQINSRVDNVYMTTLLKYLKFDNQMSQIYDARRDVQKLMDDFNDERLEMKRTQRNQPRHSEKTWEVFRAHQASFEQLFSNPQNEESINDNRLSLTLRQCTCSASLNTELKTEENEQGESIRYEVNLASESNQTNSEESRHDHDCIYAHAAPEKCVVSFLTNDYLRDIKPPSVPSDDGESIDSNDEPPVIVEHPGLVVPSDLDGELDSLDSSSPHPSGDLGHNPFLQFDHPNHLLFNSARSFILPTFHHTPPYHLQPLGKTPYFKDAALNDSSPEDPQGGENRSEESDTPYQDPLAYFKDLPLDSDAREYTTSSLKADEDDVVKMVSSKGGGKSSVDTESKSDEQKVHQPHMHNHIPFPHGYLSDEAGLVVHHDKKKRFLPTLHSDDTDSLSSLDYSVSEANGHKGKKLKKKLHRKTNSKSNIQLDKSVTSSAHSPPGVAKDQVKTPSPQSCQLDDGSEYEDADDEYDDEEEEEETCKCDRCINFSRGNEQPREYLSDSKPYLSLPMDPPNPNGNPCECQSCLRLAAVSFFAAQSGQSSSTLSGFPSNDIETSSGLQSQFYDPLQNLQSLIHPHLYGLPTNLSSLSHSGDPASSLPSSGSHKNITNTDPLPTPTSTTSWDLLGKIQTGKLGSGQTGLPQTLADWSVPHQGWLNGSTNSSSIIGPQLVSGNSMSAFQHYLHNSSMAGGAFLQPFVPGTLPLPHNTGVSHPQSAFLPTMTEESRTFSHLSSSSTTSDNQTSEPNFTISLPTTVTNSRENPHVTPNPMFPNYFSSIYAPMADFGVNHSFTPQVTQPDPGGLGSPQAGTQPIRFHPGTSVSLKDGQFNLVRGSEPSAVLFNTQFSSPEKSSPPAGSQPSFITTTHNSCMQHNLFLQHTTMPSTTGLSGTSGFLPVLSTSSPSSGGANLTNPTSATTNASQIQQQILRRKILVAQSKLSKQPRGPQAKPIDPQNPQSGLLKGHPLPQLKGQSVLHSTSQSTVTQTQPPQCLPVQETQTPETTRPPRPDTPRSNRRLVPGSPTPTTPPAPPTTKKQPSAVPPNHQQPSPTHNNQTTNPTCTDSACQHAHGANNGSATSTQSGNGVNGNGTNGSNCKYCNCCYCELFGNGGPPLAPTSKNYQEMRARLRRKLKKGKPEDGKDDGRSDNDNVSQETTSPVRHSPESLSSQINQKSVEELLSFIEGQKTSEEEKSKKAAKRARQKQRKENDKKKTQGSEADSKDHKTAPDVKTVEVEKKLEDDAKMKHQTPKDQVDAEGDKNGKKKKKKKGKDAQEDDLKVSVKIAPKNCSGDAKVTSSKDVEEKSSADKNKTVRSKAQPQSEVKKVSKSIEETRSVGQSKGKTNVVQVDQKQSRHISIQQNPSKPVKTGQQKPATLQSPDGS